MKTLFEKMRDNRVKLAQARRPVFREMTHKEAQAWMNEESRKALDFMSDPERVQKAETNNPYNRSLRASEDGSWGFPWGIY